MRRRQVIWTLVLAMLASPLHCLSEEMAKPPVLQPTASLSMPRQNAPVVGIRMCCHPTEGVVPVDASIQALKRAATALTPVAPPVTRGFLIERRVMSRSPGPPGDRLLAAHITPLVTPLLI